MTDMNHTRESLELLKRAEGHKGLREVGEYFNVKSVSSEQLITKILEAQNGVPQPTTGAVEIVGLEALTYRKRNLEKLFDEPGAYFPPLVTEDEIPNVEEALVSFCHRFAIDRVEVVPKFQAMKLFKNKKHVDWIGLNEMIKHYKLKIPLAFKTYSKRLYTKPEKRAYQLWLMPQQHPQRQQPLKQ